jgi:hypothetical protein
VQEKLRHPGKRTRSFSYPFPPPYSVLLLVGLIMPAPLYLMDTVCCRSIVVTPADGKGSRREVGHRIGNIR